MVGFELHDGGNVVDVVVGEVDVGEGEGSVLVVEAVDDGEGVVVVDTVVLGADVVEGEVEVIVDDGTEVEVLVVVLVVVGSGSIHESDTKPWSNWWPIS